MIYNILEKGEKERDHEKEDRKHQQGHNLQSSFMSASCCHCGCCCRELAYSHVAGRAGRLDVPQGLHEGGINLNVAIGDGEVLQERSSSLL